MARSPIEMMIDQACGYEPEPERPTCPNDVAEFGKELAFAVADHINTMYPKVWEAASPSARRSISGCIQNEARRLVAKYGYQKAPGTASE